MPSRTKKFASNITRYLPPPLASIIFILAFVGGMVAGNPLFSNPDTPWHLAAGDLIRASGIPATDPWSYTAAGAPWYNLSWAWDVAMSFITAHFGAYGLYFSTTAFAAVIMAVLGYTVKQRGLASDFYIIITLVLAWYVLLSFFFPQPWLATLLFVVLYHHLLHLSREQKDWKSLKWLPIIMVAWVNLHGGFAIGLSMIAVYIIEAHQTGNREWMKRLMICLSVCLTACLVNPYGIYVIPGFLRTMHSVITPYLEDWHPMKIGTDFGMTVLLIFIICCGNLRDTRVPLADRILTLAWLIYAMHTRRNFIIFAIVAAPYFSYHLQQFARHAQGASVTHTGPMAEDTDTDRKKFSAIALFVMAAFMWPPFASQLVPAGKLSDDPYKVREAVAALKPYARTQFINDYNIGGYLIYASGGTWPVFVDGRAGTSYSEDVLQDAINLANLQPGYKDVFNKYRADGLILHKTHRFNEVLSSVTQSEWKRIYDGEFVNAYVRQKK